MCIEIEEMKSKQKGVIRVILIIICIMILQYFELLGMSWIGAIVISIILLYVSGIRADLNSNYLGVYQLERELDERQNKVMSLEVELQESEKNLKKQIQITNGKINNYLFSNQRELWEEIKSEHLFDNYHEGRHFVKDLKFHFDKKEIKIYGMVEMLDKIELKKDIASIFGEDIPIIMVEYFEKKNSDN